MRLFLSMGHEVDFTACSKLQRMSFGKYVYSSLLLGFSYARRAYLLK